MLYVAQGIPWGFTATTIPSHLGDRGLSAAAIGAALAMTTLPYSFKWIWGPIMDTFTIVRFGRRRPWIVFAQLMMAATILAMIAIPDLTHDLKVLAWMIFIHTIFNSMQDVAVDALAVDLLDPDELGRANGLMYACKYLGGFIGGAGIATVVDLAGFDVALIVQAGLLGLILLMPFLVRERAGPPPVREPFGVVVRDVGRGLIEAFGVRSAIVAVLVMLSINFAYAVLVANAFALYTQRLEWDPGDYARLTGGLALLVGFAGAIMSGFLSDLFGRRAIAAGGSILMAASWVTFAMLEPWWTVEALVVGFAVFQTFCNAVMTVALIALCMELSSPRVAASQFSALMALASVAATLGYLVAGTAAEIWEYHGMYLVAAVVQVGVTGLLVFIDPSETRRVLPRPPGTPINRVGLIALAVLFAFLAVMTVRALVKTFG